MASAHRTWTFYFWLISCPARGSAKKCCSCLMRISATRSERVGAKGRGRSVIGFVKRKPRGPISKEQRKNPLSWNIPMRLWLRLYGGIFSTFFHLSLHFLSLLHEKCCTLPQDRKFHFVASIPSLKKDAVIVITTRRELRSFYDLRICHFRFGTSGKVLNLFS